MMMTASFAKLRSGEWGVRVDGVARAGDAVVAVRRDRKRSRVVVGKVVWTDGRVTLATIGSEESKAPRVRGEVRPYSPPPPVAESAEERDSEYYDGETDSSSGGVEDLF